MSFWGALMRRKLRFPFASIVPTSDVARLDAQMRPDIDRHLVAAVKSLEMGMGDFLNGSFTVNRSGYCRVFVNGRCDGVDPLELGARVVDAVTKYLGAVATLQWPGKEGSS